MNLRVSSKSLMYLGSLSLLCLILLGLPNLQDSLSGGEEAIIGWNTYNQHLPILECSNSSNTDGGVNLVLRNLDGLSFDSKDIYIGAKGTNHLMLKGILPEAAYGTIRISSPNNSISCVLVNYREGPDGRLEYVSSENTDQPITGDSYGIYNSFNSDSTSTDRVGNWLSIVNQGDTGFSASVELLGDHLHSVIGTKTIILPPKSRQDVELSTGELGGSVALYRITPVDKTIPYKAYTNRYSKSSADEFNFNLKFNASRGYRDSGNIPATTMSNSLNWIEMANIEESDDILDLEVYNQDGDIIRTEELALAGFSQKHFLLNEILGENSIGSFRVRSRHARIVLNSIIYGGGEGEGSSGRDRWASALDASQRKIRKSFTFLFNTNLNSANWIKLQNQDLSAETAVEMTIFKVNGERILPKENFRYQVKGSMDIPLHELVGVESIGRVEISSDRFIRADLVRVYNSSSSFKATTSEKALALPTTNLLFLPSLGINGSAALVEMNDVYKASSDEEIDSYLDSIVYSERMSTKANTNNPNSSSVVARVRNGTPTAENDAVVKVGRSHCTGTVFSAGTDSTKRCILTAAHCHAKDPVIWTGGPGSIETNLKVDTANVEILNQIDVAAYPVIKRPGNEYSERKIEVKDLVAFPLSLLAIKDTELRKANDLGLHPNLDLIGYGWSTRPDGTVYPLGLKRKGVAKFNSLNYLRSVISGFDFAGDFINYTRGDTGQISCVADSGGPVFFNGLLSGVVSNGNDTNCSKVISAYAGSVGSYPKQVRDALKLACGDCPQRPLSEKFLNPHKSVFKNSASIIYRLDNRAEKDKVNTFQFVLTPINLMAKEQVKRMSRKGMTIQSFRSEFQWQDIEKTKTIYHPSLKWLARYDSKTTDLIGGFALDDLSTWNIQLVSNCKLEEEFNLDNLSILIIDLDDTKFIRPKNGERLTNNNVTFEWTKIARASGYEFIITEVGASAELLRRDLTSNILKLNLKGNTKYRASIQAYRQGKDGVKYFSAKDEILFEIMLSPPSPSPTPIASKSFTPNPSKSPTYVVSKSPSSNGTVNSTASRNSTSLASKSFSPFVFSTASPRASFAPTIYMGY